MLRSSGAFERYRSNTLPFSWPRIAGGVLIIFACWFVVSLVSISAAGPLGRACPFVAAEVLSFWAVLAGFTGIWLGVALVMKLLHGEPLAKLFGATRRLNLGDALKALIAVLMVSVLAEIILTATGHSTVAWSNWNVSAWLSMLPVLALLTAIQIGGEELMFRGYMMRGLASSRRSPWVWAFIPSLLFASLHFSPDMSAHVLLVQALGITTITTLLVLTVVRTGNLGGAMGLHFGNNLFIFSLIGHEPGYDAQSLLSATPVAEMVASGSGLAAMLLLTVLATGATALLLFDQRSPLRLTGDDE